MRPSLVSTLALGLAATLLGAVPVATQAAPIAQAPRTSGPTATDHCLESRPEPGTDEPVEICYTLFRPAEASRRDPVPLVMHSHGWGGSRTTDPAAFDQWLRAGYGVLSFDQRGFGESGGYAHVENPRFEGRDNLRLIRAVSRLPWVQQDGPGDPRLGAIGGSYGGGYQYLGALMSIQRRGIPVYDALAPEITWHDLNDSLAPDDVVRSEWAYALSAAAAPTDALPPKVYRALVEGSATGRWPDGSTPGSVDIQRFFDRNGPRWHVDQGRRLDIPVLMGQGHTDTLFSLQQGLDTWRRALTPAARRESIFVGYNGGHVLPALLPRGVEVSSDPCSERLAGGDFDALARRFMDEQLRGRDRDLRGYGRLHLATRDSRCTTVRSVRPDATREVGTVAITEAAGAPVAHPVAEGPIRIAGSAYFTGRLTALGVENRAFYGLAVGRSPLDATLVQNNVEPLREPTPVTGERRRVPLPAVAVDVPAGQTLYLLASPVSDTFVGMGSRTPGAVVFDNTVVHLPVVGR
ncbi:alpha/beta hydrolase family protein [Nocardioides euryhalodurans]|uniref:Peptidase S15 n=1 Tax=Nocardioides euryhalodurans TaxID=2518370 RepID=A0A4V1BDT4_9ACTN|nr:CocE/NonD family hydrolase [Nocardioides euryhalodurans]QBR92232.1 peptidase S15 [Nocardioides euryhalodurans]